MADMVTECMKKKIKNTNIIRRLSFSFFRPKMNVSFRFVFGRKWNFFFVGIFVYGK